MAEDRAAPAAVAGAALEHRGTRAVQRMVEHAPSSGGLALWVHHKDTQNTAAGPGQPTPFDATQTSVQPSAPAWTDGHTVCKTAHAPPARAP